MARKRTSMVLGSTSGRRGRKIIDIVTRKSRSKKSKSLSLRDPEILVGLAMGVASSLVANVAYDKYTRKERDRDMPKIGFFLVKQRTKEPWVLLVIDSGKILAQFSFPKKIDAIESYKVIRKIHQEKGHQTSNLVELR